MRHLVLADNCRWASARRVREEDLLDPGHSPETLVMQSQDEQASLHLHCSYLQAT